MERQYIGSIYTSLVPRLCRARRWDAVYGRPHFEGVAAFGPRGAPSLDVCLDDERTL